MARACSIVAYCTLLAQGANSLRLPLPGIAPHAPTADFRFGKGVQMGLFDSLGKAFDNDDSLGKRQNAGLTKEKTKRQITWLSPRGQKKVSNVVAGQSLKDIARGTGIPIKYDCQEGTCKTCEALIGSQRVKICVAKAPDKDITIKYNIR